MFLRFDLLDFQNFNSRFFNFRPRLLHSELEINMSSVLEETFSLLKLIHRYMLEVGDDYCICPLSKMMRCQTEKKGQRLIGFL